MRINWTAGGSGRPLDTASSVACTTSAITRINAATLHPDRFAPGKLLKQPKVDATNLTPVNQATVPIIVCSYEQLEPDDAA